MAEISNSASSRDANKCKQTKCDRAARGATLNALRWSSCMRLIVVAAADDDDDEEAARHSQRQTYERGARASH